MQNVVFYIYSCIYCQHNYPRYVQLTKQKWNKYNNYIYRWTWQIVTATVFHSTHDFHKFIGEQTVFWILDQLKFYYIKNQHTHTSDKIFTLLKALQM
jgi:hypothetical protein